MVNGSEVEPEPRFSNKIKWEKQVLEAFYSQWKMENLTPRVVTNHIHEHSNNPMVDV
jgi:hypothetical protein